MERERRSPAGHPRGVAGGRGVRPGGRGRVHGGGGSEPPGPAFQMGGETKRRKNAPKAPSPNHRTRETRGHVSLGGPRPPEPRSRREGSDPARFGPQGARARRRRRSGGRGVPPGQARGPARPVRGGAAAAAPRPQAPPAAQAPRRARPARRLQVRSGGASLSRAGGRRGRPGREGLGLSREKW